MIYIDTASAHRLLAEGAAAYYVDTHTVLRDDDAISLPQPEEPITHPILVFGSNTAATQTAALELELRGLPAWVVTEPEPLPEQARSPAASVTP